MELTQANFDDETDKHNLVLLDFWASWCNPCKSFAPIFEAAAQANPDILFGKINTDEESELARQFEIRGIPTLIVVKDGTIVQAKVGSVNPSGLDKIIQDLRR